MTQAFSSLTGIARRGLMAATAAAVLALTPSTGAFALSELKPGQEPPAKTQPAEPGANTVPSPDPIRPPAQDPAPEAAPPSTDEPAPNDAAPTDEAPADEQNPAEAPVDPKTNIARPNADPDAPPPQIEYDLAKLPEPVRRMRQLLVDAAMTGDIEKLRPLVGTGNRAAMLSLSEATPDPIAYLKSQAGDEDGREILAILTEVLDAGYVHINVGTPQELYVWPYFFAVPLDKLNPRQTVELFKIITGGEYEEMQQYGAYLFFRVGINPAGEWVFFVSGE